MPVTFDGVDELIKLVRSFDGDGVVTKAINRGAADIVRSAADVRVPVRSGRLRSTGRVSGTKTAGVVRYGRASVPYAGPAHFGHYDRPQGGFMVPQPWLYDAADDRRQAVFKHYERQVGREIDRRF